MPRTVAEARAVSVVINVYDEMPAMVLEAIASVKAQTLVPCDIVAVEDGGPRDFSAVWAQHPDVRVIRQRNQGLAAARNSGLAAVRGVFVLFLDGDDRLLPDALAATVAGMAAAPDAALVYGTWRFIDDEGRPQAPTAMPPLGADAYAALLRGNCIGMHAAVLYRRDAVLAAGGFDASYRVCEDYELYLRLARQAPIRAVPTLVAEYRRHAANVSADHAAMLAGVLRVLAAQEAHVPARPEWRDARARGVAAWQAYYAGRWLAECWPSGGVPSGTGLRRWAGLCRLAPGEVIGVTMQRLGMGIRHWLGGRAVAFGDLRRTEPISTQFGFDRGRPVDRYYIEAFLQAHAADVRGRVLEVGDDTYTRRFGGSQVTAAEVLHVSGAATGATYCADLTHAPSLPDDHFDCIVLTQTLHLIFDVRAALETLHRILKPGGCLLLTAPGVSSVDRGEWHDTWYWSLTPAALARLCEERFGPGATDVAAFGNVLSATAFLYGLADRELTPQELDVVDRHYPVIVAAAARKRGGAGA